MVNREYIVDALNKLLRNKSEGVDLGLMAEIVRNYCIDYGKSKDTGIEIINYEDMDYESEDDYDNDNNNEEEEKSEISDNDINEDNDNESKSDDEDINKALKFKRKI